MKNTFYSLILLSFATYTFFTSCTPNKRMAASQTRIEKLKKDSIKTHQKLAQKLATDEKKKLAPKESITKSPTPVVVTNPVTITPLPSEKVANIFKSSYPLATEITWTREVSLAKLKNKKEDTYKASFLIKEARNSAIYAEDGKLIETREQILPNQLPQTIYNAIKNKYSDAQILSASTFKSTRTNGTYTAVIKSLAYATETEVILTENGTMVE